VEKRLIQNKKIKKSRLNKTEIKNEGRSKSRNTNILPEYRKWSLIESNDSEEVNKRWSEQLDLQEEILFDANDQSFETPIWKKNQEPSRSKKTINKKFGRVLDYEEAKSEVNVGKYEKIKIEKRKNKGIGNDFDSLLLHFSSNTERSIKSTVYEYPAANKIPKHKPMYKKYLSKDIPLKRDVVAKVESIPETRSKKRANFGSKRKEIRHIKQKSRDKSFSMCMRSLLKL